MAELMKKKCPQCGAINDADDMFCANCGTRLVAQPAQPAQAAPQAPYVAPVPPQPQAAPQAFTQARQFATGNSEVVRILSSVQGLLLAAYGIFAVILHGKMNQFDFEAYGSGISPVHICYLLTIGLGIFLIIYGIVKDRTRPDYFKSMAFLLPVIVTVICLIFSQANTVATASLSIGDLTAIDKFVYGSMTVVKYLFVTAAGLAAAALAWIKR